jgi:hypothetical protein
MTTIRAFTIIAALASASAALADPAPAKKPDAPAKAPAAPAAPAPATDKPAASKKEVVSDADAQKFLAFFDKLVSIVVANQDDCTKMAAGINGHMDANQPLIKAANDARSSNKDLPPTVKEKIEKRAKEDFVPALTKKCAQDQGVQNALMRMGAKH